MITPLLYLFNIAAVINDFKTTQLTSAYILS